MANENVDVPADAPLFIHIPKAAGMSIRNGLRGQIRVAGSKDTDFADSVYLEGLTAHMKMRGEHHGRQHVRWRDVAGELKLNGAFAIVRNPWARAASRYFFGRFAATETRKPQHVNYKADQTFEEFLEERHTWGHEPFYWHRAARGWYPSVDYVTDEAGELRVTCLRCEHLADDMMAYRGWKLPPRRRNVTINKIPLAELYKDPKHVQIIADWYARDVAMFGFDFDSAATRNVLCAP
jgi:hypothetical protein